MEERPNYQNQINALNSTILDISLSVSKLAKTVNLISSSLNSLFSILPEGGVSGGYETFDDAKSNFTEVYKNITNIYQKVQKNRNRIASKCSKLKCVKIHKKVKKVKSSLDFLQRINVTILEKTVEMLKNDSVIELVSQLKRNMSQIQENYKELNDQVTVLNTNTTRDTKKINDIGMPYE